MLANYGVKVTIVEFLDRMLPLEDEEVSKELAKRYKKLGVDVLTSHQGRDDRDTGDTGHGHRLGREGAARMLEADKVLQAIGFQPRIEGYGLEKTRRAADRARRHRHRRLHAHQRAAHLRDRRRDRRS